MDQDNGKDMELVSRALAGDSSAEDEIMTTYKPDIMNKCMWVLNNDMHASEDMTHEALIKALQKLGDFKKNFSLKGWLITTAKHTALNYLRSDGRRKAREDASFDGEIANQYDKETGEKKPVVMDKLPTPVEAVQSKEEYDLVHKALEQLGEPCLDYLLAKYFDDLTARGIGEMLGVTTAQAEAKIRSCKQELKEIIEDLGYEPVV